jgi:hypothetical protein
MCVVSMIGDEFSRRWEPYKQDPNPQQQQPNQPTMEDFAKLLRPPVNRDEFEALKKEVELMRDLLKAAKLYDEKNNEPSCEIESKVALLKAMAKMMGVDLSEVFK